MAVDMFLKIGPEKGDPTIKGESKDAVHANAIEVQAWEWGMHQTGTAHNGSGAGAGKVSVSDMTISKFVDKASPSLMLACCKGTHFPEVNLFVRKAGDKPMEYYKVKLENVLVSGFATGANGGQDRFSESIQLNFGKFKVDYFEQQKDGSAKKGGEMGWDIPSNKSP